MSHAISVLEVLNNCADQRISHWSWPEIPGLHEFQGHMCHSADFEGGYDFSGKKVAVVGNGSSGVQIVPEIQKAASQMSNFVRSKTVGQPSGWGTLPLIKPAYLVDFCPFT